MSRSNYDKPFYVDVGTSIVAVRCASNHDVVLQYDHSWRPGAIELAENACARMNKEAAEFFAERDAAFERIGLPPERVTTAANGQRIVTRGSCFGGCAADITHI